MVPKFYKVLEAASKFQLPEGDKNKFHTEEPKKISTTLQNLLATATSLPGFVNPLPSPYAKVQGNYKQPATHRLTSVAR
jgi:hypothetical protein